MNTSDSIPSGFWKTSLTFSTKMVFLRSTSSLTVMVRGLPCRVERGLEESVDRKEDDSKVDTETREKG